SGVTDHRYPCARGVSRRKPSGAQRTDQAGALTKDILEACAKEWSSRSDAHSGVTQIHQLETLEREPWVVGGETSAFVHHQRGEVTGRHDGHRRGIHLELLDHPGDNSVDLAGDAEHHSGLQRLDRITGYHRTRPPQFDHAQLGTAPLQRLQRYLDSRRYGAADVLP